VKGTAIMGIPCVFSDLADMACRYAHAIPPRTARGRGQSLKRMKGLPLDRMRKQYTCRSGSGLLSDHSVFLPTLARLRPARSSVLCQCERGENEYSDESAFVMWALR